MKYAIDLYASNKMAVVYVLTLAILRGVVVPDFRYGLVSVVVIQIAFPIALAAVFLTKDIGTEGYLAKSIICISGIVLAQLVSIAAHSVIAGSTALKDPVTSALFLGSFAAQVVVFLLILALLISVKRISG